MRPQRSIAFTLVELTVAIVILGIIAAATAGLVHVCLEAHRHGVRRAELLHSGSAAMERLRGVVREATNVRIASGALSIGLHDAYDDADPAHHYLEDPLLPMPDPDSLTTFTYSLDGGASRLIETRDDGTPPDDSGTVADGVSSFSAAWLPADADTAVRVRVYLRLADDTGYETEFREVIYPNNLDQRFGWQVP